MYEWSGQRTAVHERQHLGVAAASVPARVGTPLLVRAPFTLGVKRCGRLLTVFQAYSACGAEMEHCLSAVRNRCTYTSVAPLICCRPA